MGKVYIRVQTKTAQKLYPMVRHIYMANIREYHNPPPPTPRPTKSGLLPFPSFSWKILSISKSAFTSFASVDWAASSFLASQRLFVSWRLNSSTFVHCRIFVHQGCFKTLFITISDSRKTTASNLSMKDWIEWLRIKSNFQLIWSLLKPRWYVCTCQWHVIQFVKSNSLKRILCGLKKMYVVSRFFIGKTPVGILRNEKAMTKGMRKQINKQAITNKAGFGWTKKQGKNSARGSHFFVNFFAHTAQEIR